MLQSRSKRSGAAAQLLSSHSRTSADGSASTRVTRARVDSSLQSIVQQKLDAARSKQSTLSAPAAASSSSATAVKSPAPVQRRVPAKVSQSNKKKQNKARLAQMRAQRDAAAADSTDEQQTQTTDQQSKQSVIPVAAGSPPHWDPIDPAHGNTTLVLLSKDNPKHAAELSQVQQSWTQTLGNGSIVSVHRVQNLTLWSAYAAMKAQLQKSGSLAQSDAVVYHGTRHNSPALIHAGSVGFDPSKGASGYCWFAANASYSSQYFSVVGSSTLPFGENYAGWLAAAQTGTPFDGLKQIFQAQLTITSAAIRTPVRSHTSLATRRAQPVHSFDSHSPVLCCWPEGHLHRPSRGSSLPAISHHIQIDEAQQATIPSASHPPASAISLRRTAEAPSAAAAVRPSHRPRRPIHGFPSHPRLALLVHLSIRASSASNGHQRTFNQSLNDDDNRSAQSVVLARVNAAHSSEHSEQAALQLDRADRSEGEWPLRPSVLVLLSGAVSLQFPTTLCSPFRWSSSSCVVSWPCPRPRTNVGSAHVRDTLDAFGAQSEEVGNGGRGGDTQARFVSSASKEYLALLRQRKLTLTLSNPSLVDAHWSVIHLPRGRRPSSPGLRSGAHNPAMHPALLAALASAEFDDDADTVDDPAAFTFGAQSGVVPAGAGSLAPAAAVLPSGVVTELGLTAAVHSASFGRNLSGSAALPGSSKPEVALRTPVLVPVQFRPRLKRRYKSRFLVVCTHGANMAQPTIVELRGTGSFDEDLPAD